MNEYKITTSKEPVKEPVTVDAHKAAVTSAGALVLWENSGQLVRAFACGAWLECELVKRGPVGYC